MARFVVVADAVTVSTGEKNLKGRPHYTRVIKGQHLNGKEESATIQHLLHKKAIVRVANAEEQAEAQKRPHRTARELSQVQGAPDDPVQPVVEDIEPVPAPVPDTTSPALVSAGQPDLTED